MEEKMAVETLWLGQMEYQQAWELQDSIALEIAQDKRGPVLLLLEHPHTFTLGRRGEQSHLLWDEARLAERGVSVHWVDRGGDITYHGPGQLVGYPLLRLTQPGWQGERIPQADYVGYIRGLEESLIWTLAQFGIVSAQRQGLTGVWVPADVFSKCRRCRPEMKGAPAKIASIGVKVDARGVSRHGFALNVSPDMSYWDGIIPCGLDGVAMVSMADLIQNPPSVQETAEVYTRVFNQYLAYQSFFGYKG